MTRPRGRPAAGEGVKLEDILITALMLLEEGGGQGLTLRALASRLGVTPMSLYHHVGDQVGLLKAISDRVYAAVMECPVYPSEPGAEIEALLLRFHAVIGRHPQLTLAIITVPQAFAGVTQQITDRLTTLLKAITTEPILWRDILVDHAHGSGLALAAIRGDQIQERAMTEQYRHAQNALLGRLNLLSSVKAGGCRSVQTLCLLEPIQS